MRLRGRLTYSNVIASLALFVALGGTGYAATMLPRNSVGSRQIRRGGVKNSDIAGNAVTSGKVRNGSLVAADFAKGVVGGTGAPGARGPSGPRGAAGSRGPTGRTGATGPKGATGGRGATGSARAWGVVDPSGPTLHGASSNVVSVRRASYMGSTETGAYCVKVTGATPADTVVASVDYEYTSGAPGNASVEPQHDLAFYCGANELKIYTFRQNEEQVGGTSALAPAVPDDDVAFTFAVY